MKEDQLYREYLDYLEPAGITEGMAEVIGESLEKILDNDTITQVSKTLSRSKNPEGRVVQQGGLKAAFLRMTTAMLFIIGTPNPGGLLAVVAKLVAVQTMFWYIRVAGSARQDELIKGLQKTYEVGYGDVTKTDYKVLAILAKGYRELGSLAKDSSDLGFKEYVADYKSVYDYLKANKSVFVQGFARNNRLLKTAYTNLVMGMFYQIFVLSKNAPLVEQIVEFKVFGRAKRLPLTIDLTYDLSTYDKELMLRMRELAKATRDGRLNKMLLKVSKQLEDMEAKARESQMLGESVALGAVVVLGLKALGSFAGVKSISGVGLMFIFALLSFRDIQLYFYQAQQHAADQLEAASLFLELNSSRLEEDTGSNRIADKQRRTADKLLGYSKVLSLKHKVDLQEAAKIKQKEDKELRSRVDDTKHVLDNMDSAILL